MTELDVHTHLVPINAGRLQSIAGVQWTPGEQALVVDGHRVGMKQLFDAQRLLEWMDASGVRKALVSVPPPVYRQDLAEEAALEWVTYLNEELAAVCAKSDRLSPLFYLPTEHPRLLEKLLERAANGHFAGIAIAAGGHPAIDYSQAVYAPVWEWMQARGSFVFIHPGTCRDARLANFYLENLVGNPYETAVAATHLVMAGVPSRYPAIRFCLAHAGGMFTSIVGRLQKGFDTRRPGVDLSVEPPLQAARRFYSDCIAHHPSALRLAQDVFGVDKVLFGSDWPFPMGLDRPE
jgi:aminocarboxymuconate-semialdehyde decarboxylase